MNAKKLTILISILLAVTLVVVLTSTIFTLKTISFNFLNQRSVLKDCVTDDYLSDIDVPYGDSIFLVDKESLTSRLEKENAYLQVISVETTFPSNIVVHASEREEVYAIRMSDNTYAITDKSLKILRFCDDAYLARDGYLTPVIVDIDYDNVSVADMGYEVCDFIEISGVTEILSGVVNSFLRAGYSVTTLKGFATNITLREEGTFVGGEDGEVNLTFVKTVEIVSKYGIKISINNAYADLAKKVALGLKAYEAEHDKHNTTGEIMVFAKNDELIAIYSPGN